MSSLSGIEKGLEIDAAEHAADNARTPYNKAHFESIGATRVWEKYDGILSFGEGQTLAIADDGCNLTVPEWQTVHPWGKKVIASWNVYEENDDPSHVPPGLSG